MPGNFCTAQVNKINDLVNDFNVKRNNILSDDDHDLLTSRIDSIIEVLINVNIETLSLLDIPIIATPIEFLTQEVEWRAIYESKPNVNISQHYWRLFAELRRVHVRFASLRNGIEVSDTNALIREVQRNANTLTKLNNNSTDDEIRRAANDTQSAVFNLGNHIANNPRAIHTHNNIENVFTETINKLRNAATNTRTVTVERNETHREQTRTFLDDAKPQNYFSNKFHESFWEKRDNQRPYGQYRRTENGNSRGSNGQRQQQSRSRSWNNVLYEALEEIRTFLELLNQTLATILNFILEGLATTLNFASQVIRTFLSFIIETVLDLDHFLDEGMKRMRDPIGTGLFIASCVNPIFWPGFIGYKVYRHFSND